MNDITIISNEPGELVIDEQEEIEVYKQNAISALNNLYQATGNARYNELIRELEMIQ